MCVCLTDSVKRIRLFVRDSQKFFVLFGKAGMSVMVFLSLIYSTVKKNKMYYLIQKMDYLLIMHFFKEKKNRSK